MLRITLGRRAERREGEKERGSCADALTCADAKGYTRGFENSIGYKKGYAAGQKLAREQASSANAQK
jgi:hypothetical protein